MGDADLFIGLGDPALRDRMGLDLPIYEQFAKFLSQVVRGDLGTDVISGRPILAMVLEVLPYTTTLAFTSMGLATASYLIMLIGNR